MVCVYLYSRDTTIGLAPLVPLLCYSPVGKVRGGGGGGVDDSLNIIENSSQG
jgi:hypothetical protein